MNRPYAEWAPTLGGVYLYLLYDAGFVSDIKTVVPPEHRHWDADEKVWYVGQNYASEAIRLSRKYWPYLDTTRYDQRTNGGYDPFTRRSQSRQRGYQWASFNFGGQSSGAGWSQSPPPSTGHPALAKMHLLPTAPPEVVKAVFRALAMLYHPDKGGSAEQMRELNEAYDQLRKAGKV